MGGFVKIILCFILLVVCLPLGLIVGGVFLLTSFKSKKDK